MRNTNVPKNAPSCKHSAQSWYRLPDGRDGCDDCDELAKNPTDASRRCAVIGPNSPPEVQRLADELQALLDRAIPCGHQIADLIHSPGSVTKCGACIVELKKDEPIADPAERARVVAKILRGRGIWAVPVLDERPYVRVRHPRGGGIANGFHDVDGLRGALGPRAIADEIQRQEAERAREWAGDEVGK